MVANGRAHANFDLPLILKLYKKSLPDSIKELAREHLKLADQLGALEEITELKQMVVLEKVKEVVSQTEEDFVELISGGWVHE